MCESRRLVSIRLVVQPDIELRKEPRRCRLARRCQNRLRRHRPLEHLVNFAHRRTLIGPDRQECRSRLRRRFGVRHAEKVPGRVLDVVGIDRAVRLELLAAVVVASNVIERDAALPELRRCVGTSAATRSKPVTDSLTRPARKSSIARSRTSRGFSVDRCGGGIAASDMIETMTARTFICRRSRHTSVFSLRT